ncbi:hypothetical protein N7527_006050 [Penicillium freii]|nr:hypothetical protein N7527_006050 [Penicillium freii]
MQLERRKRQYDLLVTPTQYHHDSDLTFLPHHSSYQEQASAELSDGTNLGSTLRLTTQQRQN